MVNLAKEPNGVSGSKKIKIVVSDCHLSAGRFYEGKLNPHEDFHFDDEMVALFEHFSTGEYGGDLEVELIINGDFLDPLNVPIQGEFEDSITEAVSVRKIQAVLEGHPKVCDAIRNFASKPGKQVTYLIGNHDADLFFPKVRETITRRWDPKGEYPSTKVRLLSDVDRITYAEGVEIRHGNQFEAGSILNFESPILTGGLSEPVLNLPWSSFYVLKIINRLRWERDTVDKVRPVKAFILIGLLIDPWFTIRFCFLSTFYFLRTRFIWSPKRRSSLGVTLEILKQETRWFLDLEREARAVLDEREDLKTLILGHTHRAMNKVYPDGKQYINTGTWTKMIHLDWGSFGQPIRRTFAYIELEGGRARCELRQWVGERAPHSVFTE